MSTFTQLHDTPLTTDVALASWCPTMDLCAVVTTDGQLQIHRLNWQVLWVTSPDQLITSICWRPDGKVLAAGHTNGSLTLFNVEGGHVQLKTQLISKPWDCLAWAEQASPSTKPQQQPSAQQDQHSYRQRFERLFEPPPEPVPSSNPPPTTPFPAASGASEQASKQPTTSTTTSWPPVANTLNILAGVSSDGKIVMSAFGEAQLAEVARATNGSETVKTQQLALTPDLQHALLLEKCTGSTSGRLQLSVYNTSILARHSAQLHQMALLSSRASQLLKGAQKTLKAARSEWKHGQADLAKRIAQLSTTLADHGRVGVDLQEELLALLATGHMHPGLHSWLCSVLGEPGLRRLARSVDAAVQAVHTLVLEHLLPVAQLAGFLLGELLGLARACQRLPQLGLQVPLLQQAEAEASKLVLRTELLRSALAHVGSLYRSTFGWLLRTLKLAEGQHAQDQEAPKPSVLKQQPALAEVAELLEGQLLVDGIGPELEETPGAATEAQLAASSELLFREGCVQQCSELMGLMYGEADAGPWPPRPLGLQLKHLMSLCDSAFAHIKTAISPHISLVQQVNLLPVPVHELIYMDDLHLHMSLPYIPPDALKAGTQLQLCYSLTDDSSGSSPALCLLQLQLPAAASRNSSTVIIAKGTLLTLTDNEEVVDLGFYKPGQLAMLLQQQQGSSSDKHQHPSLALLEYEHAALADVDITAAEDVSRQLQSKGLVVEVEELVDRVRELGYDAVQRPLGVSRTRGVACVFGGLQRAAGFDLEEDEEGEGQEEEEDGEEEEDDDDDESMGS